MTSFTSPSIAQAQEQFEALLEVVGGPGNRELSAAAAELTIFRGCCGWGRRCWGCSSSSGEPRGRWGR